MIAFVNFTLSLLTIIAQLLIVFLIVSFVFRINIKRLTNFSETFLTRAAFVVSLVATSGSLFYSQIAGFIPCELCWFQRIFMYPQIFLLGLAIYKKDRNIIDYSLLIAIVGFFISLYHNFLVYGAIKTSTCSISAVSCTVKFVIGFEYVTIPLMSLTAFASIILLLLAAKFNNIIRQA